MFKERTLLKKHKNSHLQIVSKGKACVLFLEKSMPFLSVEKPYLFAKKRLFGIPQKLPGRCEQPIFPLGFLVFQSFMTNKEVIPDTVAIGIAVILLMPEILHQLRLVVFPIVYRVSAPSQVVQDFSHQQ